MLSWRRSPRRRGGSSLALLPDGPHAEVLLVGVGSGLDLPLLPRGPRYTGLDLTPAMLARARRKATALKLDIQLDVGDARRSAVWRCRVRCGGAASDSGGDAAS
jgi:phosphatidylethanolamine/phosphatidyl-N-methylethanolamine N-methyltransferase